jgi:hypothetical protein
MKRHHKILLLTLVGITATVIIMPRLVRRLSAKPIPDGWGKTLISIKNIEPYEDGYAYTLSYNYQEGELEKTLEQYILDDRKPKSNQSIAAIYQKDEPILFELQELIQYEK